MKRFCLNDPAVQPKTFEGENFHDFVDFGNFILENFVKQYNSVQYFYNSQEFYPRNC